MKFCHNTTNANDLHTPNDIANATNNAKLQVMQIMKLPNGNNNTYRRSNNEHHANKGQRSTMQIMSMMQIIKIFEIM